MWNLKSILLGVVSMPAAGPLQAFPPAPYYTIYGDVRDEYGVLLPADGSAIVMYQGGVEKMRETLTAVSGADYNYQIRMRIDMGRSLTSSYSSLVVSTASAHTLIDRNGDLDKDELSNAIEYAGRRLERRLVGGRRFLHHRFQPVRQQRGGHRGLAVESESEQNRVLPNSVGPDQQQ